MVNEYNITIYNKGSPRDLITQLGSRLYITDEACHLYYWISLPENVSDHQRSWLFIISFHLIRSGISYFEWWKLDHYDNIKSSNKLLLSFQKQWLNWEARSLYYYINQEACIWTYWHGCRVEPVRNLVVSVPCLTCRTARTFTTLARRGTYLTPQLRVKCFIYTSQEHKIYPCVFGKRSLPVITSLLMQSGRTASYPFSFPQSLELRNCQRSSLKQLLDPVII